MIACWKAYWIMRGVEAYLIRIQDSASLAIVTPIVDSFEREQAQ